MPEAMMPSHSTRKSRDRRAPRAALTSMAASPSSLTSSDCSKVGSRWTVTAGMVRAVVRIAVSPDTAPQWVLDAVVDGGATLVPPEEADGLVWFDALRPDGLPPVLAAAP